VDVRNSTTGHRIPDILTSIRATGMMKRYLLTIYARHGQKIMSDQAVTWGSTATKMYL
jgi:hypothetical protein